MLVFAQRGGFEAAASADDGFRTGAATRAGSFSGPGPTPPIVAEVLRALQADVLSDNRGRRFFSTEFLDRVRQPSRGPPRPQAVALRAGY
eukprot:2980717-Lingulodinium_polyedra.AAC.1